MTDLQSILSELRSEIEASTKWDNEGHIPRGRIESIVRKFETEAPGDTSTQPGEYAVRGGNVEAFQHNGTVYGAHQVKDWIANHGGIAHWLGTFDQEVDYKRIRLNSPRMPNIINPGWWVVKTADGIFFTLPDPDFRIVYVRKGE